MTGTVYLVGAGPGDPGLLTLRAAELLRQADMVLYDRLVDPAILDMIPDTARREYVGRSVGDDAEHQNDTNRAMLECAQKYESTVRLKGGDPTMFGRGGEEAEFLRSRSIPFQIVPGITSGMGSAAYSGIPLTHREISSSVAFVTGHESPGKAEPAVNWRALAKSADTIVVVMGLSRIRAISDELVRGGMDPETPAAMVYRGTTKRHRAEFGTLSSLPEMAERMRPPVNIIIGGVVDLHRVISWR